MSELTNRSSLGLKLDYFRKVSIEKVNNSKENAYYPNSYDLSFDKKDLGNIGRRNRILSDWILSSRSELNSINTLKNIIPNQRIEKIKVLSYIPIKYKESNNLATYNSLINQTTNYGTQHTDSRQEIQFSSLQLKKTDNTIHKKNNRSTSLEAKVCLNNMLKICKNVQSKNIKAYNDINKFIQGSIKYYDVSNPVSIHRDKVNMNFSKLLYDNKKVSLSYLSKDKKKMFTVGPEKSVTNYIANLNPDTLFKFKDMIKGKYEKDVITNKTRTKPVDYVPLYILNNPLQSQRVLSLKLGNRPKHTPNNN